MFACSKTAIAFLAAAAVGSATAKAATVFDPLAPCGPLLAAESEIPQMAVGFWAFGFLDSATDRAHSVTPERLETMLAALRGACAAAPDSRMIDIAIRLAESQTNTEPDAAEDGRALLMRFFDPAEDRGALTLSLKPTPDDVRAVYGEPIASALIAAYEQMFQPGAVIQPKPDQNQLLTTFTTTAHLKAEDPVLDDFPGGYKDVLPFIIGDVPIARFKFVKKGETLGLAFDGLIHVNDRWVFMPKPWRMLPEAQ
jgi:hypothetical protein